MPQVTERLQEEVIFAISTFQRILCCVKFLIILSVRVTEAKFKRPKLEDVSGFSVFPGLLQLTMMSKNVIDLIVQTALLKVKV